MKYNIVIWALLGLISREQVVAALRQEESKSLVGHADLALLTMISSDEPESVQDIDDQIQGLKHMLEAQNMAKATQKRGHSEMLKSVIHQTDQIQNRQDEAFYLERKKLEKEVKEKENHPKRWKDKQYRYKKWPFKKIPDEDEDTPVRAKLNVGHLLNNVLKNQHNNPFNLSPSDLIKDHAADIEGKLLKQQTKRFEDVEDRLRDEHNVKRDAEDKEGKEELCKHEAEAKAKKEAAEKAKKEADAKRRAEADVKKRAEEEAKKKKEEQERKDKEEAKRRHEASRIVSKEAHKQAHNRAKLAKEIADQIDDITSEGMEGPHQMKEQKSGKKSKKPKQEIKEEGCKTEKPKPKPKVEKQCDLPKKEEKKPAAKVTIKK